MIKQLNVMMLGEVCYKDAMTRNFIKKDIHIKGVKCVIIGIIFKTLENGIMIIITK